MLTPHQIKEVVSLQNQSQGVQVIIDHITDLIKQLAQDACTLTTSFNMHNEEQHQKNKAQQYRYPQYEELSAAWEHMIGMNPLINLQQKKEQPPCRQNLIFSVTEATGIRILNAVLQEKKELQQLLQQRIEKILIRTMKIELTEQIVNPIQELNQQV